MSAVELVALAGSLSLLAGWRLYLCVLATGIAMQAGWIALPQQLAMLDAIASPWVIGAATIGLIAEFLADKVAWVDSLWDGIHSFIRPVGGALLALAIVDPADPRWQIVALLLGGGAALIGHGAKAGTRALVNASPEPVSNIVASSLEDVTATAMVLAALANPWAAGAVLMMGLAFSIALLLMLRGLMRRLRGAPDQKV
jgi:hypothetical protein